MKYEYSIIQADFIYEVDTGVLLIETQHDFIRLDRDEVTTLAEKLRDWALQDEQ